MKKAITTVLLVASCVAATPLNLNLPRVKVSVVVLSESTHKPLDGAEVKFALYEKSSGKEMKIRRMTGIDGKASAEGGYRAPGISNEISREGFYEGWAPIPTRFYDVDDSHRMIPWNEEYPVILRPIVDPVAMYAKMGWIEVPSIGKPCGFDLERGDWVAPNGTGIVADLIFTLNRDFVSRETYEVSVKLTFSNPLDGIQEIKLPEVGKHSVFTWPREAPESGYNSFLLSHLHRDLKNGFISSASDTQAFVYRVRTKQKGGKITDALYGKIKGGFKLAPSNSDTCKILLSYYLNPTSLDRNLESDISRNLFGDLEIDEAPRWP
jgi:hypothetical protein